MCRLCAVLTNIIVCAFTTLLPVKEKKLIFPLDYFIIFHNVTTTAPTAYTQSY